MYALLDNNDQLVAGKPVEIYRKPKAEIINDIQYPRNWMQALTLAEKQAIHVWPLVAGNTIDSDVERAAGDPTYTFDNTNVIETIPTQDLTLAGYQAVKIRELTGKRDQAIVETIFLTLDATEQAFSADAVVRELLFGVITAINSGMTFPASFEWSSIEVRDETDTVTHTAEIISPTEAQTKTLAQVMLTQYYNANKQFINLRVDTYAATTRAEVDAITWV